MEEFLNLLNDYGLWALAFGAFFQGYCLVFLAGLFVSQQALDGPQVWIVAAGSAWVGHWFFFFIGRWLGKNRQLIHSQRLNKQLDSLDRTITVNPWTAIFFTQYGYGVRIIGAIAFGVSHVRRRWFAWAQSVNCAIWATVLVATGYATGSGFVHLPQQLVKPASLVLTVGFLVFLMIRRRRVALQSVRLVSTKEK